LFPEAAAVSVHFREEAAGSREQADDFRALAVDSPVEAADFRAQADVTLGPAADFHASVADSLERADDSRASAVDSRVREADFLAPGVDFLGRADGQVADSPASVVDFLELVAASWLVEAPACSLGAHCFAGAADSHAQAAGSLERVGEPGVELLAPAVDFRAWAAALADSAKADSLVRGAHFREPVARSGSPELARWRALAVDFRAPLVSRVVVRSAYSAAPPAAPSGSLELARWRALAVDCRVPLVSQAVLRSTYSAALSAAFLLRAALADWLAVLRVCLPAALEQASHSP
jgi:hypothetical protein